eukprot:7586615-Pyramimonas_sp.AAC.1
MLQYCFVVPSAAQWRAELCEPHATYTGRSVGSPGCRSARGPLPTSVSRESPSMGARRKQWPLECRRA